MLNVHQLQTIATQVRAARNEVRQIEPFSSRMPGFDLSSAYAAADLIHRARVAEGDAPVGRKIGFANSDMWSLYGVREPIWGYMYDTTVVRLTSEHGTCSLGRFAEPKIEPEIVFHLRAAPAAGAGIQGVLESIDWVAHAFEIVQSHFPGWKFQAADTVVDGGLHGTLLIGEPQPIERIAPDPIAALQSFKLSLACDGVVRETGTGANVLGSPLIALAHLVEVLTRQPDYLPLQAGEIVTTGTITTAQPLQAGETWRTSLQGIALPGLMVEFVP